MPPSTKTEIWDIDRNNGKARALSIAKFQLAWQPHCRHSHNLRACEQGSLLSIFPLDVQEKVQFVGWVQQLFLKKVGSILLDWLIIISRQNEFPFFQQRRAEIERKADKERWVRERWVERSWEAEIRLDWDAWQTENHLAQQSTSSQLARLSLKTLQIV